MINRNALYFTLSLLFLSGTLPLVSTAFGQQKPLPAPNSAKITAKSTTPLVIKKTDVVLGQNQNQGQRPKSFLDKTKSFFGFNDDDPVYNAQQNQQHVNQQQNTHNHAANTATTANSASQTAGNPQYQHQQTGQQVSAVPTGGMVANQRVAPRPAQGTSAVSPPRPAATNTIAVPPAVPQNTQYASNAAARTAPNNPTSPASIRDSAFSPSESASVTRNVGTTNSAVNSSSAASPDTTINRLNQIRGSIFEKTADDRERISNRKTDSPIVRKPAEEGTISSKVGVSSTKALAAKSKVEDEPEDDLIDGMEERITRKDVQAQPRVSRPALPEIAVRPRVAKNTVKNDPKELSTDDSEDDLTTDEKIASSAKTKTKSVKTKTEQIASEDEENEPKVASTFPKSTMTETVDELDEIEDHGDLSEIDDVDSEKVAVEKSKSPMKEELDVDEKIEDAPESVLGLRRIRGTEIIANKSSDVDDLPEMQADRRTTKTVAALKAAVIDIEVESPNKSIVGQESLYKFKITNKGGAAAEQVVMSVEIPVWAEIQTTEFNIGTTNVTEKNGETHVMNWFIDNLEPGEEQPFTLNLIPRQRKALNMVWDYRFRQTKSQNSVEVLEAALEMTLDGPSEMLSGTDEEYRLRIRNTGNGDAENLNLTLVSSSDPDEEASYPLEILKAGDEISLKLRAHAKQQDELEISVTANGPYGLQAETSRKVKVLRPKLKTIIEAPEMQFVGNENEYRIVVQNEGTAPAQNVEIKATIPSTAKYVSNQGDARTTSAQQNNVVWSIDSIPVGEEYVCILVCEMRREGTCKLDISTTEKSGISTNAVATTQITSIADLGMKISNPQGPVEVGKVSTHKITITNRGSKAAENVEVIAAFAEGVTPQNATGPDSISIDEDLIDVKGGQVFFETIPLIGPRESVELVIKAKAETPGNHKIRVEMVCEATETHLVNEDSTHYYNRKNGSISLEKTTALRDTKSATSVQKSVPSELDDLLPPEPAKNIEKKPESVSSDKHDAPIPAFPDLPSFDDPFEELP